jgi:hypothetical protein
MMKRLALVIFFCAVIFNSNNIVGPVLWSLLVVCVFCIICTFRSPFSDEVTTREIFARRGCE